MSQSSRRATPARPDAPGAADDSTRPSHCGGAPAQERELRAQGRRTMRRLLEAGRTAFAERGLHGVRVDDVVRAARTSHGTFYLYFANKEDLFKALARDAMQDMSAVAAQFPAVAPDPAGRRALRDWVTRFCDAYHTHAPVIRILGEAEVVGKDMWEDSLGQLRRLSRAVADGMRRGGAGGREAELTALACLTMIERVNYLITSGVRLPEGEVTDRLTDITFAAFFPGRGTS